MKQTFLVFPSGSTGLALLLLRASVAISLIAPPYGSMPPNSVQTIGWNLLSLAVAVGLYTRAAATVSVVVAIGMVITKAEFPSVSFITFAFAALALALIGPGAASIDARRFGRRKISLTP